MNILEALKKTRTIRIAEEAPEVVRTAAEKLQESVDAMIECHPSPGKEAAPEIVEVAIASPADFEAMGCSAKGGAAYFQIKKDGSGRILVSRPYLLYGFLSWLLEVAAERQASPFSEGKFIEPAFRWQRASYDFFLTQEGRIQQGLDRESYVREMARLGFTHIEVNGLASPMGLETGPEGEAYPMFYTYCPALDQFVDSSLNRGLYPKTYLSDNLAYLKENAALARKYGLTPGLLCFEPRSVPEAFFERYPMLRGARVDHPIRSFKPRYNMTIVHPRVREHYAEMMRSLMREVPELGFICIWTNDSGAGFEHTKSLYVGRNGGAYLIREWKDDEEIARRAGENALRFFRTLRDAGRALNPGFRVLTRLESFYGEHDTVWQGLGEGMDVETASLIAKGWDIPYAHPRYPESRAINAGTVYQQDFDEKEKPLIGELEAKDSRSHYYFSFGPHWMFEPLLGIPYPFLCLKRLKILQGQGVGYLAMGGGTCPPELAPYNINHEVERRFFFDPKLDPEKEVRHIAGSWVGEGLAQGLVEAWKLLEEAILAFPNVTPLYSAFGFSWYRLWVRPFVPDIEALPEPERAFYEDFMCTTPHNPNNVDLARDVLFQLTTLEKSRIDLERIDENLWPSMDEAIDRLRSLQKTAFDEPGAGRVIHDQLVRFQALRCWFMTQRNVAAWIAGVHGYLAAKGEGEKQETRALVRDMMEKEIGNTMQLKELLESDVEFMALTDQGETPLVHGTNLTSLLDKRIAIMKAHFDDEPASDPDYMERRAQMLMD
jgi:hypothetical protein